MTKITSFILLMAGLGALPLMSGCVEREEKIHIFDDGTVAISCLFLADSLDEFYEGRVPSEKTGWKVRMSTRTNSNGKVRQVLAARQDFPEQSPLPSTYAHLGLKDASLYLRFPTFVSFEERKDGTYCHFRRIYKKRPWAHIASLKDLLCQGKLKALMKKDPKKLPKNELIEFIRGMALMELHKMLTFARNAFHKATPGDHLQDGWLLLFNDVLALQDSLDYDRVAALVGMADHEGDLELAHVAEEFEKNAREIMICGLRTHGNYTKTQEDAFLTEYKEQERCYELSEDIENEKFSIAVEMPGEVIGANTDTIRGNIVFWKFNGKALQDRDHEIIASSRITN